MEGSNYVNWNSIIYRKEAIDRKEIERLLLGARGFNTNLVQFLLPCHVTINNMHVCSFTRMISNIIRHAPKRILHALILRTKNYNLWRPVGWKYDLMNMVVTSDKMLFGGDFECSLGCDMGWFWLSFLGLKKWMLEGQSDGLGNWQRIMFDEYLF